LPKKPGGKRLNTVLRELEDDTTTTEQTIGYRDWIARILKTNLRVYRLKVELTGCDPKTIQQAEGILNGLHFPLLRVDPMGEGKYRFNHYCVSKLTDLHDAVLGVRAHMLRLMKDRGSVAVHWKDVTEADGDWHVM
jgi:hypothetical protein